MDPERTPALPASGVGAAGPRASGCCHQFALLLKKFARVKAGNIKVTLLELFVPIYPVAFLFFMIKISIVPSEVMHTVATASPPPANLTAAAGMALWMANTSLLGFAPDTPSARATANATCALLWGPAENGCLDAQFFESEAALVAAGAVADDGITSAVAAGVSFTSGTSFTLVHHDLEMGALVLDEFGWAWPGSVSPPGGAAPFQMEDAAVASGLVLLQAATTEAILGCADEPAALPQQCPLAGGSADVALSLTRAPEPARTLLNNYLTIIYPMMLGTCLFMSLQASMTQSATEIERGIKEALLVKGMRRDAFWFAWLLGQGGVTIIAALVTVVSLYAFQILETTSFGFMLGLMVVGSIAQTAFGLMIVSMMGRGVEPKKCFILGIIILMVITGVYYLVEYLMIQKNVGDAWIYLTFLFYIIPQCHILFHLSDAELLGTFVGEQSPHMGWAFGMLLFDTVLYIALILYYDYSEEAKSKKSSGSDASARADDGDYHVSHGQITGLKTDSAESAAVGIRVRKLSKLYGEPAACGKESTLVHAVKGIDFDVPEKHIFALLGHNGAGKTTTINMLIGSVEPTSGDAWVGGLHIVKDREELRSSLGLCPQFDVLYDEMTPAEQLRLYGGMAGLSEEDAAAETDRLLELLKMTFKANEPVRTLSGGQKRRISLATALIGNPRRILLDEPTTGMDPANRRGVWKVLQEQKQAGVNVVMTTHSMEEADILGDTIGIMADGKLEAFGPSLELKRKYGLGYHLHCERPQAVADGDEGTPLEGGGDQALKILAVIQANLKGTSEADAPKLLTDVGTEISFGLPSSAPIECFPALLGALEAKREELGVLNYGLSATTLEEVFLNLDKENKEAKRKKEDEEKAAAAGGAKTSEAAQPEPEGEGDGADPRVGDGVDPVDAQADGAKESRAPSFDPKQVDFVCEPSTKQQMHGVLSQVILLFTRNKMSFAYVAIWPIVMAVIAGLVNKLFDPEMTRVPVSPDLLNREDGDHEEDPIESMGVAYPFTWEDLAAPSTNATAILGAMAGAEVADLNATLTAASESDTGPYLPGAFEFSASGVEIASVLTFNQSVAFSARVAVEQLYLGLSTGAEVQVSYMQWANPLMQNSFGVGGLQYITASAFAYLAPFYTEEMVRLRISRVKDMMLLSGLSRSLFWGSYWSAHFILQMFSALLSMVVMLIFGMDGVSECSWISYLLLFASFGCSNIWWGYTFSFFVNSIEVAQEAVGEVNNLLILVPWAVLTFATDEQNVALENALSIIPAFGLYRGLAILETAAKKGNPVTTANMWEWDRQLVQAMVVMLLSGVVFLLIVLFLDDAWSLRSRLSAACKKKSKVAAGGEDEEEASLPPAVSGLKGTSRASNVIHAEAVSKAFTLTNGQPFKALKDLSLGIPENQIFGLLGPNGAGKTTLIKCITGAEATRMDDGDVFVAEKSCKTELDNARKFMGVCPQFDALLEDLTAREHLRLFARIRGVPAEQLEDAISHYIAALDLQEKADMRVGTYSGGNKRKLSVAMSMISNPRAVFLDEPSTGMDPGTRRFLWDFIDATRQNRAMVLTTHSMEEADALCSNIGIMIKGALRTVGSSQQLKAQHGSGYRVAVRLRDGGEAASSGGSSSVDKLALAICKSANVEDGEKGFSLQRFEVPMAGAGAGPSDEGATLGHIFSTILEHQDALNIVDFSVSQATLEDVFLEFAASQF